MKKDIYPGYNVTVNSFVQILTENQLKYCKLTEDRNKSESVGKYAEWKFWIT